ncbi:hypothetical protein COCOBI_04-7320 [Coccomyxa sp. Obi]|nr:hypothetical protein COCOBI_04-7320 [Coccomyxa sp. Obi]
MALGICRAQKQSEVEASTPVSFLLDYAASLGITKDITRTQAYSVWLQGAVVLVILAAIDAAYSGDWSRIGVISKEVELGLRPLLALLGFFHIFCGGIAAIAASKKGYNPVPPTMKVLAVGFLALVEVLLKDPAESA